MGRFVVIIRTSVLMSERGTYLTRAFQLELGNFELIT